MHYRYKNYPVHTAIKAENRYQGNSSESEYLQYTAATCGPNDFTLRDGYTLRTQHFNRKIELMIGITYYNEDKALFTRTLYAVMKNIRDIIKDGGPPWQNIVVCLIFDGARNVNASVLDVLTVIGVYQHGILESEVDGKGTVAHIFEYTTQLCVTPECKLTRPSKPGSGVGVPSDQLRSEDLPPAQIILCLKQNNSKKINSHRWLFNAFGRILNPEVVVLIDSGTRPSKRSLMSLWQAFKNDKNLGGACGEIHAMLGRGGPKLLNPLVAIQNFEYKMSNIMDKPLESCFGYVTVLPGAFSAYRFRAIMGRPLDQYFRGDHTLSDLLDHKGIGKMNIFKKNMFLAEDRILCFEIVAKAGQKWRLGYVQAAKAETDVPENAAEFLGQRRRWMNGSFAAGLYSLLHFGRLYRSGHGVTRLVVLHIQFLYNLANMLVNWFSLASYYLTTTIIMDLVGTPVPSTNYRGWPFGNVATPILNMFLKYLYLVWLIMQFILSLGNRPKASENLYSVSFWVFGSIQGYVIVLAFYLVARAMEQMIRAGNPFDSLYSLLGSFFSGSVGGLILLALVTIYGFNFTASCLCLDPWHMFHSFPQYLLLSSTYINVLTVYAFSNWHDVSWGTKGPDQLTTVYAEAPCHHRSQGMAKHDELSKREDFAQILQRALTRDDKAPEAEEKHVEDSYKAFRTGLVIAWILCNLFIITFIIDDNFHYLGLKDAASVRAPLYFQFLLYITILLSLVRFIGFMCFLGATGIANLRVRC